ncbi:MAG: DNA-binding protein [Lachnospiraceae bacterium]|nr:DNA-binding protein [Lachnospiraceae bacterium]
MGTGNESKICAKKADAKDWLAEAAHLSVYFSYYGELLGEKTKRIFEDYVANDMSLSEIAREYGLSRQGVYDVVKRCGAKLYEYEECLHLAERFRAMEEQAELIRSEAAELAKELDGAPEGERAKKIAQSAEELVGSLQ